MSSETQSMPEQTTGHAAAHEEIHLPPPTVAPIIVAFGAAMLLMTVVSPLFTVVGLVALAVGGWKMIHFPEVDLHPHFLEHLNDRKLGTWIFIASEVMFFAALIGAFIFFKVDHGFEAAHEVLSLPLATVGTSVLIVSSFAVVMGLEALQSDDRRVFFNWMFVTLALGITFLGIQAAEWSELMREDITEKTMFGTTFFVTTGFHGLHVFGGVVWLALLLFRAGRGVYSSENHLGVELFGLYWHFVDVVWIVLFTIIYLID